MKYKVTNISNSTIIVIYNEMVESELVLTSYLLDPGQYILIEPVMNGFLEKQSRENIITIEEVEE